MNVWMDGWIYGWMDGRTYQVTEDQRRFERVRDTDRGINICLLNNSDE